MKGLNYLLEGVVIWCTPWLYAQHTDTIANPYLQRDIPLLLLEENLEEISKEEEEVNWEDELEELSWRLKEPLNLNSATKQQLEQFPFLNDWQIENILAYRYFHGPMKSIYELQAVEAMDKQTLDLLLPFVCVCPISENQPFPSWKQMARYGRHEWLTRLDVPLYTRVGYRKEYLGPSLYHSFRYTFRYGEYVQAGITGEKDAGEPWFGLHNSQGYDSYSYYVLVQSKGRLKTLALGNYRLSFGQGLVLGQGFGLGKSFSLSTSDYRSKGIRKHGSTDEYHYFRGLAATVEVMPRIQVSAFYSHRSLDGVVEHGKITSIYKTGLHRTESEAAKKHALVMQVIGSNVAYDRGAFHAGVTGLYYFFNHPYTPQLSKYAQYNLQGNDFYNVSLDYRFCWGKLMASGEVAKGKKGYALLNRIQYAFSPDCRVMLLHRYYAYNYWSFFGHAWGEGSTLQNEQGWYVAAEVAPWTHWRFFASLDFFSFPWWKYRISKPSEGWEGRIQSLYMPWRNLSLLVSYQYKRKERDIADSNGQDIRDTHHHHARGRLTYQPGGWRFQTTGDYTHFHSERKRAGQGWQLTQSGGYGLPWLPLTVTLQGTYFHTDDFDSRVYAYEKGLLYTFYTPSFFGRGFRTSVHLRYDLSQHIMFLVKVGHTCYQDRNAIGTGHDLINSNRKTDIQLQCRLKL